MNDIEIGNNMPESEKHEDEIKNGMQEFENTEKMKEFTVDKSLTDEFPADISLTDELSANESLTVGLSDNEPDENKKNESLNDYEKIKKQKKIMKAVIMILSGIILVLVTFLITRCVFSGGGTAIYGRNGSNSKNSDRQRQNTLKLVESYLDNGLYDQALGLLNNLFIENPEDPDALELFKKAAELRNVTSEENEEIPEKKINIDTSGISDVMQTSIDSMKQQIAQQSAENEKNVKAMNRLLEQQQKQNENNMAELQKQQERQRKAEEKKLAEEKAEKEKKEEIACKNEEFKKFKNQVEELFSQAKAELSSGNLDEALKTMSKVKNLLDSNNTPEAKKYASQVFGEMASRLYEAGQSESYDAQNAKKAKDAAVGYANDTLKLNSHDSFSHFILGMNAGDEKKNDLAEKELKIAVQEGLNDKNNYLYYYHLGRIQYIQKKYSEARASFVSSVKCNPAFAPSQYNLGVVLEKLNSKNDALQAYRKAFQIDTLHEKSYLAAAKILSSQKEYGEAVNLYRKAINVNPKNINTYKLLGSTYSLAKNYKAAEDSFKKAVNMMKGNEEDPLTYYNLSTVLFSQDKVQEALDYAKNAYDTKLLAQKNVQVNIIYNYAVMCDSAGEFEQAVKLYQEVIKNDPKNIKAKINLAVLSLNQGEVDSALSLLEIAYKDEPGNFEVNNNLGSCYLYKKQYNEAIKFFKKSLEIDSKNMIVKGNLAAAYAGAQMYEESRTVYLEIIKNERENYDAYIELSKVCLAMKDYTNAEAWLLHVQSKKPDYRKKDVEEILQSIKSSSM